LLLIYFGAVGQQIASKPGQRLYLTVVAHYISEISNSKNMKILNLLFACVLIGNIGLAKYPAGKIVVDHLYSAALENKGGENPTRRVTVYLPPGYEKSDNHYPVIYFLHGFTSSDSLNLAWFHTDKILDQAIAEGKIRPVILVIPNQNTLYRGSFYTNSSLTGNWADFTAKDLVEYIDKNYRTIPNRESRGITGWSMGGFGAIKIGMLFPSVFSTVYALSPFVLGLVEEVGINGQGYKRATEIKTRENLVTGNNEYYANAVIAMGRAFSPNLQSPPILC
jgi:S-formylglutathione hydrolase FrmB